jgi:hypothetical protein
MAGSLSSVAVAQSGQYGPQAAQFVWLRPSRLHWLLHSSRNPEQRASPKIQAPGSLLRNRRRHSRHRSGRPRSSVSLRSQDAIRPAMAGSLAGRRCPSREARRRTMPGMSRQRAVQAVRELAVHGRSSTLALFDLDPCGDAHALAELATVLLHQLAAATGRDPQVLLDDLERRPAQPALRHGRST